MPRKKKKRLVQAAPAITGFRINGSHKRLDPIMLFVEEYETIRLLDHEGMKQEEAAVLMDVSRPTLTRMYESARKKVAESLALGRNLVISGGTYETVNA